MNNIFLCQVYFQAQQVKLVWLDQLDQAGQVRLVKLHILGQLGQVNQIRLVQLVRLDKLGQDSQVSQVSLVKLARLLKCCYSAWFSQCLCQISASWHVQQWLELCQGSVLATYKRKKMMTLKMEMISKIKKTEKLMMNPKVKTTSKLKANSKNKAKFSCKEFKYHIAILLQKSSNNKL